MSDYSLNDLADQHKLDQDLTRERNQKKKWALGETDATEDHPKKRPIKPLTAKRRVAEQRAYLAKPKSAAQLTCISRKHAARDTNNSASDSSAEEDVVDASAVAASDAGYTYSFDAPTGPSKGSQILGQALAKAVERFETKATEKLVKSEYEMVAHDKEEEHAGYSTDDDFEIV